MCEYFSDFVFINKFGDQNSEKENVEDDISINTFLVNFFK